MAGEAWNPFMDDAELTEMYWSAADLAPTGAQVAGLRAIAAAAWQQGASRQFTYGPHSVPNEYTPNPYVDPV